ncbi:hypothetical protein C5B42_01945 [Candidatus Cerribacteria bacterium 'Amazon FNV 2010 28 9']|uniref:Uncharacterized protein n=1 Tax=Candidatus Cerribacteria bacterium 'Amazon FNV 2010 28 9' TaxID=2081795 RepID=A0A317JPH7_9BACT|nr:MAG: hypothetical protein C5B42_01945 [Candidatus Cerribacteria bacterium 'Amazon FNV 2010 28 9']
MTEQEHGEEASVRIGDKDYPKSVVETAQRIAQKTHSSLEEAIRAVIVFEQAERNAKPADPNEPIRVIFRPRRK